MSALEGDGEKREEKLGRGGERNDLKKDNICGINPNVWGRPRREKKIKCVLVREADYRNAATTFLYTGQCERKRGRGGGKGKGSKTRSLGRGCLSVPRETSLCFGEKKVETR